MTMKPKNALTKLGHLLKAPSFTCREATRLGVGSATLAHYTNHGELERLGEAFIGPLELLQWRISDGMISSQLSKPQRVA